VTLHLVRNPAEPKWYRIVDVVTSTSHVVNYDESPLDGFLTMTEGMWLKFLPLFRSHGYETRVLSYSEEQEYGVRCKCRPAARPY
jgi:hypothetical protein